MFLCGCGRDRSHRRGQVSNPCASGRCSSDAFIYFKFLWDEDLFQTPAPRGGVPLARLEEIKASIQASFKPLRLGAVFLCLNPPLTQSLFPLVSNPCASGRCSSAFPTQRLSVALVFVSNPCASGRCSSANGNAGHDLQATAFQTPAPRGGVPLGNEPSSADLGGSVSNPCASGRCSSVQGVGAQKLASSLFQTPAPRGGVPLIMAFGQRATEAASFKPLRLGAVFL